MAIITDPDNLDRFQVLVDYENEVISIRAANTDTASVIVAPSTDGIQRSGENALYAVGRNFGGGGSGVEPGQFLVTVDGPNINHWTVTGLDGNTGIFVDPTTLGTFNGYVTDGTQGIVERFNEESAVGNYQYVYQDAGSDVDLFILKNKTSPTDTGYQWLSIRDFTLPNDNQQLLVFQIEDRNSNIF